jgi:flagellar motility protein MotE (MotC chaperone)
MNRIIQIILLLLIIFGTIGGIFWFMETEGIADVSGTLTAVGSQVPWLGEYVAPAATATPAAELRELERLKEEEARERRLAQLKLTQEELLRVEGRLNEDRSRLAQWENEIERREAAIDEREKQFTEREKQYERSVKFYLSMRPAAAAKVLAQQEDLLVIELFRRMPERNVAAILAEMDPTVSGAIMRKMSR